MLRKELMMKGVAPVLIDRAFEELGDLFDERALLESVAERRVRQLGGLDAITRKRRLYDYLLRRGFRRDYVREIIERH
jgi:SOS response regulatory protein OraA/RecX